MTRLSLQQTKQQAEQPGLKLPIRSHLRFLYFVLAWIFFALGIIGIILPVMPGTIFIILAAWAFSKSSPRFHRWLYYHRWFGPPLQRWAQYRVVTWKVRVVAYGSMLSSLIYFGLIARVHWAAPVSIGVISIIAVIYIGSCPSRYPDSVSG